MSNRLFKDEAIKQAENLGYSLCARYGEGTWVFHKADLFLEIQPSKGCALLRAMVRMVKISLDGFSWPHPKFEVLESQMQKAIEATKQALGVDE